MAKKPEYSALIGLKKSLKNVLITCGPALIAGLTAFREQVPAKYQFLALAAGMATYFLKNLIQNK